MTTSPQFPHLVGEILIIFATSHLSSAVVHFLEKPANAADTVAQLCNSPVSGGYFFALQIALLFSRVVQ